MRRGASYSRREMMALSTAALGAAALPLGCDGERSESPVEPHVFNAVQRSTLEQACERLLPGATVLGVMTFIERSLRQHPFDTVLRKGIILGADELEALSRQRFQTAFVGLDGARQDELLGVFQRGELKKRNFTGRGFFDHLLRLTLEGYFGDPKHGGNRHGLGWQLIGFENCWWAPKGHDHGG